MKSSAILIIPAMLMASSVALAERYKHIEQTIDASDLDAVKLEISVGEVDIEIYDGNEIQFEIDIEAQRSRFSFRRAHAEDVELEIDDRGSAVYIGITESNIEQPWLIRMPAKLALDIEMGVGDIDVRKR